MKDPYAALAAYYDLLVPDWQRALEYAGERLETILRPLGVVSVLDCTCGTGIDSIALARKGYQVTGSDVSRPMLTKARQNARLAGATVRWLHADVRSLRPTVPGSFDAVISCGSSLSHLVGPQDLSEALASMFAVTREGGYLLIALGSSENIRRGDLPFTSRQIKLPRGEEVSFFTTVDCGPDKATLNVFIARGSNEDCKVTHVPMELRLIELEELSGLVAAAGFTQVEDLSGAGAITLLAKKTSPS